MNDIHPDVQAALDMARELRHQLDDMREQIDRVRSRRPSPSGMVIPEVDAMGRLTDLYLAPGTCAHFTGPELVAEIMAAISESCADASVQRQAIMEACTPTNLTTRVPDSLAASDLAASDAAEVDA
jgi:DNA-binding protein YbaB